MIGISMKRTGKPSSLLSDLGTFAVLYDEETHYLQALVSIGNHQTVYTLSGNPAKCEVVFDKDGVYDICLVVRDRTTNLIVDTSRHLDQIVEHYAMQDLLQRESCRFVGKSTYRLQHMLLDQARLEYSVGNPQGFNRYINGNQLQQPY